MIIELPNKRTQLQAKINFPSKDLVLDFRSRYGPLVLKDIDIFAIMDSEKTICCQDENVFKTP